MAKKARARSSLRGIDWARIGQWILDQRDRVIIFGLAGAIGLLVFYLAIGQDTPQDRLERRMGQGDPVNLIGASAVDETIERFEARPMEDGYGPIITQNIFETSQQRADRVGRIRRSYEQGRRMYEEERQLERARSEVATVLELDPFERMINYPEKPSSILARIDRDLTQREVSNRHERMQALFPEARNFDNDGNLEQAKNRYGEILRLFGEVTEMDPDETFLGAEVYDQLKRDIEQVRIRYEFIVRQSIGDLVRRAIGEITQMKGEGDRATDIAPRIGAYSQARDRLSETFRLIDQDDPERQYVAEDALEQLEVLEQQVLEAISELKPEIRAEIDRRLGALGPGATEEDLQTVNVLIEAYSQLEPDAPQLDTWLGQYNNAMRSFRQARDLARLAEMRTRIQQQEQSIKQLLDNREYDRLDALLLEVEEARQEVEALARGSDQVVVAEAMTILAIIRSFPQAPEPIRGYRFVELTSVHGRRVVVLCQEASGTTIQFFERQERDGVRLTEIALDGSWVNIEARRGNYRQTRLPLEADYQCGG